MPLFRVLATWLLFLASSSAVEALTYRVAPLEVGRCGARAPCPLVFVASGEIQRNEVQSFRGFVGTLNQRAAAPRAFIIDSPGGNLAGALGLGGVLRRIGLPVVVGTVRDKSITPAFCGSACVYVLMGGRSRRVPAGSTVAVHSLRRVPDGAEGEGVSRTRSVTRRQVTRILENYARLMGVDPAVIALSMRVPVQAKRVLTPAELRRFGLSRIVK